MMWGMPLVLGFSLILMFGVFVYYNIVTRLDMDMDDSELHEGELL